MLFTSIMIHLQERSQALLNFVWMDYLKFYRRHSFGMNGVTLVNMEQDAKYINL